tara:strand:- start:380 stop:772 length:393 start_codon:yes stop_codon:yes gene_type:complete
MSTGLSVSLPLVMSPTFGAYHLNTTFAEVAKQNLKMLILTVPGERIMDPHFGVGLKTFLFEQQDSVTYSRLTDKILSQVATYLPYLSVTDIDYGIPENNPDFFPYDLTMKVKFTIKPLHMSVILDLSKKI